VALHILKLCVGVSEVSELADWQERRLRENARIFHVTRMMPRRRDEVLDGGSLYWVIRAKITVRQQIIDIEPFTDVDGINRCRLVFDPELVLVKPVPKRAFQGWRYLKAEDAPADLSKQNGDADLPVEMRLELAELGLL
jgi:hypothetical protein